MSTTGIYENNRIYYKSVLVLNYLKQMNKLTRTVPKEAVYNHLKAEYEFHIHEMAGFNNIDITVDQYINACTNYMKKYVISEDDTNYVFENKKEKINIQKDKRFELLSYSFKFTKQTLNIDKELIDFYKENLIVIETEKFLAITNTESNLGLNIFDDTPILLTNDFKTWFAPEFITLNFYKKNL